MNERKNNIKSMVLAIIIATGIVMVSLLFFNSALSNQLKQSANNILRVESDYNKISFKEKLNGEFALLRLIADYASKADTLEETSLNLMMKAAVEKSSFSRIAISDAKGESIAQDSVKNNIANREYFKKAMKGKENISEPLDSMIDGSSIVVLAVPVFENDTIIGSVRGVYDKKNLEDILQSQTFINNGYVHIIKPTGEIVITTNFEYQDLKIKNIFQSDLDIHFYGKKSVDAIKEVMKNGETGVCQLTFKGERYYSYYQPLGYNNWYIVSVVSSAHVMNEGKRFREIGTMLICLIALSFILLTIYLTQKNRQQNKEITQGKKELDFLIKNIQGGVEICSLETEQLLIEFASEGLCEMSGYFKEALLGRNHVELVADEDKEKRLAVLQNQMNENNGSYALEYRLKTKDGRLLWVLEKGAIVKNTNGHHKLYSVLVDISEQKERSIEKELSLINRAERDGLTHLYNKTTTENKIKNYLLSKEGKNGTHAFIIFDIDYFKNVNDFFGHAFGDAVIAEIGKKLQRLFREEDILGRIGGDEFVVLMKNSLEIEIAKRKAKEMLTVMEDFYDKNGKKMRLSISIGIALCGKSSIHYTEIYQCADAALYQAKNAGRNTFVIYEEN